MKKKLLMLTLSVMLVLSGCGQEAAESTGASEAKVESSTEQAGTAAPTAEEKASEDKESSAASGAAATKQGSEKDSTETQKESEKADKAEATATPESTQKPETEKETTPTEKPTATAAPTVTKVPASTPKAEKPQASTDGTQTSTGSNQSGTGKITQSSPTSAPVVSAPTPEPHTQCTWDGGSVTQNASCASEGTTTYTCTVCGNTKTESIARTSHNYVTTTTEATCTTGGSSKTYCSNCGDVQSETSTGGGLGHDFQITFWNTEPTCSGEAYYRLICSRCEENGGDGTAPPLGHSPVSEEICHGDCSTETIVVTTCSSCGLELGRNSWYEDEGHEWVTGTSQPIWSEEVQDFVTYEVTYCTKCNAQQ